MDETSCVVDKLCYLGCDGDACVPRLCRLRLISHRRVSSAVDRGKWGCAIAVHILYIVLFEICAGCGPSSVVHTALFTEWVPEITSTVDFVRMARQAGGPLREQLLRLLVRLLKRTPKLALRFVLTVISPGTHLKRLALVSALQLLASLVHYAQKTWTRGLIWKDRTFARQANARTYEEWRVATQELELERPRETDLALPEEQESFFEQLRERATNYAELRLAGDEYGLMFHLRSELMRQQLGNRGYSREGCVAAQGVAVAPVSRYSPASAHAQSRPRRGGFSRVHPCFLLPKSMPDRFWPLPFPARERRFSFFKSAAAPSGPCWTPNPHCCHTSTWLTLPSPPPPLQLHLAAQARLRPAGHLPVPVSRVRRSALHRLRRGAQPVARSAPAGLHQRDTARVRTHRAAALGRRRLRSQAHRCEAAP
jgi:hypothetical protein